MASILRWIREATRRAPWPPLRFPTTGFELITDDDLLLEEEQLEGFEKGLYYPVNIGDVFMSKYQVVGKLGYGVTSTVWLARDLQYVLCITCIYPNTNKLERMNMFL
jgi:serine/threonine-protein kinase SRPK3